MTDNSNDFLNNSGLSSTDSTIGNATDDKSASTSTESTGLFRDYYSNYLSSGTNSTSTPSTSTTSTSTTPEEPVSTVSPITTTPDIKPEEPSVSTFASEPAASVVTTPETPVVSTSELTETPVVEKVAEPEAPKTSEPVISTAPWNSPASTPTTDVKSVVTDAKPLKAEKPTEKPTEKTPKQSKNPSVFYTLTIVLVTIILCFGVIYAGAKFGALNGIIKSDVESEYTNEQANKAFSKDSPAPEWTKIFATVNPSVVSITINLGNSVEQGSGFMVDKQGHIVTNNHVVADAAKAKNPEIAVTLNSGRIYKAEIVGRDELTDLAVIKLIDPADADLVPIEYGDSDTVVVGDEVLAVGNPLGLANTATRGIVSALDRPVTASEGTSNSSTVVTNSIQIDAAINPGNSGGPLFDASGKVIGVNSSIAQTSSQSGSVGLGFAIPVNVTKSVIAELITGGEFKHPALGVSAKPASVEYDGAQHRATEIVAVSPDGPAGNAGIQKGDFIIAVNKKPVISSESLIGFINTFKLGTEISITIIRDGKQQSITVKLDKERDDAFSGLPTQNQTQTSPDDESDDDGSDLFDPFEEFFGQR